MNRYSSAIMRSQIIIFASLSLLLLTGESAVWAASHSYQLNPDSSHIKFKGKSSLHEFDGEAKDAKATLILEDDDMRLIEPTLLILPVSKLTTHNIQRDHEMQKMFNATKFSYIQFEAKELSNNMIKGQLTIKGITREIDIPITMERAGNEWIIQGKILIDIRDFDLSPPNVLGIIRVSPEVVIEFLTHWNQQD